MADSQSQIDQMAAAKKNSTVARPPVPKVPDAIINMFPTRPEWGNAWKQYNKDLAQWDQAIQNIST